VPNPGLCGEDPAANQLRCGAIWVSLKVAHEFLLQRLRHAINLMTLLLLLLRIG
jgi:hypothetical protein